MSNQKQYIDIRVTGYTLELLEFLKVCKTIEYLGTIGSSKSIKVNVDGDGSGKLSFEILPDFNEIPLNDVSKDYIKTTQKTLTFNIGE